MDVTLNPTTRPNRRTRHSDIYRTPTPAHTSQKLTAARDAKVPTWPKGAIIWKAGSATLLVLLLYKTLSTAAFPTNDTSSINKQPFTLKIPLVITVTVNIEQLLHTCTFINGSMLQLWRWLGILYKLKPKQTNESRRTNVFLKSKGGGSVSELSRMINPMRPNKWDQSFKPESLPLGTTFLCLGVVLARPPSCQNQKSVPVEAEEGCSPWQMHFWAPVCGRAAIKFHSHCQLRCLCCAVTIQNCLRQAEESLQKQGNGFTDTWRQKPKRLVSLCLNTGCVNLNNCEALAHF